MGIDHSTTVYQQLRHLELTILRRTVKDGKFVPGIRVGIGHVYEPRGLVQLL